MPRKAPPSKGPLSKARKADLYQRLSVAEAMLARLQAQDRTAVKGPEDAVALIRNAANPEQETFIVILLDARQKPLSVHVVAIGTLASVEVHPRDVFREAVRMSAHSIVVGHNHPSGDPSPSDADVILTKRLAAAGKILGIPVLDHIVVSSNGRSCSLAALDCMREE